MIKVISGTVRHPSRNFSLEEFHRYWAESHGPLCAQLETVRRYTQHLSLPEAYGTEPSPSFDGISIFWYDDLDAIGPELRRRQIALREAITRDRNWLFDNRPDWPRHLRRARLVAEEHVVFDGETHPGMVKLVTTVARLPGLTHEEFFDRWLHVYDTKVTQIPGVARYVQNHAIVEALPNHPMTHDGWSEVWYEDLATLHRATLTREWRDLREAAYSLFHANRLVAVAHERVVKDFETPLPEPEALRMTEQEICERLRAQGYDVAMADLSLAARVKRAAQEGTLGVWSDQHLVIVDDPVVDIRPVR